MATPKIPSQKGNYQKLNSRLDKYVALVEEVYKELNDEAAKAVASTDYRGDTPFRWKDYPQTTAKVKDILSQFVDDMETVIHGGTSTEWKNSNTAQDLIANNVLKSYGARVNGETYETLYQTNPDALEAFQKRKDNGMSLSRKLWDQSEGYKSELEAAISCAIQKGTSAITLSKRISQYLLDFPSLQKDYKELFGAAANIHDCEYRSARLARSEINMAYRAAENERWKQMDFVVGMEIKTTQNGKHEEDVCDTLAGKYPKDFQWTGWHPNCYDDKSKILTGTGWKYFADVLDDDLILSLNPDTRRTEWVKLVARQKWRYSGDMAHFTSRNLDCLVTPDHRMVYLGKNDQRIRYAPATRFRMTLGAFYRGCANEAGDTDHVEINGREFDFDWFCVFMGYWLSDGSVGHAYQVTISQKDGEKSKPIIAGHLAKLGVNVRSGHDTLEFNDADLYGYLRQFGNAQMKHIPIEIMNASKRQIRLFLDAFSICDGHRRKPRRFVGSRGNLFSSDRDGITYFTTSGRMAGQLCELLMKVGGRPSFRVKEPTTAMKKDGSLIHGNYPCYHIRECHGTTATTFSKNLLHYEGYVYDLTLERNHIMYVSRNGRCFWGSNCRCYKIPIMKTEEEFWADDTGSTSSVNEVRDVPDNFRRWCKDNGERIEAAEKRGTLPYFVRDNKATVEACMAEKSTPIAKRLATVKSGGSLISIQNKSKAKLSMDDVTVKAAGNGKGSITVEQARLDNANKGKGERRKFDKEYNMCEVLLANGYDITMLKEEKRKHSPDIKINGKIADLKSTGSVSNIVNYGKYAVREQGAELVVFEFKTDDKAIYRALGKLSDVYNIHGLYYFEGTSKLYEF